MTDQELVDGMAVWSAPECPFQIEYSTRVLDDIRLAVVDAFFSLPRGGAEIGGVLLGAHEAGRVTITGYQALDCEHAMGPSFTLSAQDQVRLAELMASAMADHRGSQPVGWYHSHTRSEIFLSEADQDIHRRFFPEPWQVALVLKPHTFEPTRGGFFFTEPDGSIRGAASYQEFLLEQLPARPVPSGDPQPRLPPQISRQSSRSQTSLMTLDAPSPGSSADPPVPITRGTAVPLPPEPPPTSGPRTAPATGEPADEAPHFLQAQNRSWRFLGALLLVAAGVAIGGIGYQTRPAWLPGVMAKVSTMLPQEPAPHLGLGLTDQDGQLQIHWDRSSTVVRNAIDGTLEITDGPSVAVITLDAAHLRSGAFTYSRARERVDVALVIDRFSAPPVREVASFLGRVPEQKPPAEDPQIAKQRDALAQQASKLQRDLAAKAARTRKLEKDLNDVRDQLQKEQRRRLANQLPDQSKND